MQAKPLIAVTQGDPAGVGPEIIVAAWNDVAVHDHCRPVVVGHPAILRRAAELWQTGQKVVEIGSPEEAEPSAAVIPCIPVGGDDVLDVPPGTIDARTGEAAYQAVVAAARLALAGQVDAITTAPLHKEALHCAGHHYPGHTELLAELCGAGDFAMMLYLRQGIGDKTEGTGEASGTFHTSSLIPHPSPSAGLAVVHVTLHTALRNVFDELSAEGVLAKARLADRFMARLKGSRPRIGVCALNPHGGEGGLFGDEEHSVICRAVARGLAEGLDLTGPLPADTVMVRARDGQFDAVVAMYHDQGHIALKLLGMHRAVNVTLGLPIIRTSVAHGTAFDIAWQRKAQAGSMIEALRVASLLVKTRDKG
jgi:4-phospho-D-threonate 3-dehydrogenase / 4-phospho-D-erythronate 3-dehydrogenase